MNIDVYINFKGNCREAVEFYAKAFGVEKQQIMTYGDGPEDPEFPLTEETKNLVMHTWLNINGKMIMFSDTPEFMPFLEGNNVSLIINSQDPEEIKSLYEKLKEGGTVAMELQETFFSKYYAYITDKFGIGWQFNLTTPRV